MTKRKGDKKLTPNTRLLRLYAIKTLGSLTLENIVDSRLGDEK